MPGRGEYAPAKTIPGILCETDQRIKEGMCKKCPALKPLNLNY
jgi:hypothetical protein